MTDMNRYRRLPRPPAPVAVIVPIPEELQPPEPPAQLEDEAGAEYETPAAPTTYAELDKAAQRIIQAEAEALCPDLIHPRDLLITSDVRRLAGNISRSTLIRWRRERGFPAPVASKRVGERRTRDAQTVDIYDRRKVRAWLREHAR